MSGLRLTGGALGALALLAGMGPGFQQGALDRLWVCSPPMAVSGPKLGTARHPALAEFWERRGVAFMWLDEEGAGQDIDALAALGRRHGCDLIAVVALESSTKRVSKLLSPMAMKATVTIHALLVEVGAERLALRRDADFSHSERVWFSQGESEKAAVLQAVRNSIQASFGSYPLKESRPTTLVPLPALASTGLFTVVEAGFVWAVGDGFGPTLRVVVAPTLDTPWEAEIQATFPDPLGGPDIVLRSGPLYGTAATLESPPLAGQGCEVVTVRLAVLGAVEAIRSGTTCLLEIQTGVQGYAGNLADTGMRLVLADSINDVDESKVRDRVFEFSDSRLDQGLQRSADLIQQWHGKENGRVTCFMAPHAPETCSPGLLRRSREMAETHDIGYTIHLSQSTNEVEAVMGTRGVRPAQYLFANDLLGPRLVTAHCRYVNPAEVALLGGAHTAVSNNAAIAARRGAAAPVKELQAAGCGIGMGSDNMAEDMVEVMRAGLFLERVRRNDQMDPQPEDVLEWAMGRFQPRLALSSSFGAEDVALIDMMWRINPKARVFTLDTLRLPTETYTLMDQIRLRYDLKLEVMYPDMDRVRPMVEEHGFNLFYKAVEMRQLCCGIRKVEPLERAMSDLDAWITGLRRDQVTTRAGVQRVEIDEAHGDRIKINPLADWSSEQVWEYIHEHQVPYNELHDKDYPSIGCAPCTRAVLVGEDPRAGRWWWESDPNA
ncbi:phosphoadenylyl-sulfate reductase, partial [bacterium]|nr:phosphoadenylyl-sulfate reductase [bacterium]